MGTVCSNEDNQTANINTELLKNRQGILAKQSTLAGIEHDDEVAQYSVGTAIESLTHDYASRITVPEYMEILAKHKVNIYYSNTLAHICAADGTLGEKERKYCEKNGASWGLTDEDMKETLQGKDCSKELVEACDNAAKEWLPQATPEQHKGITNSIKLTLLMDSIIAATQDGLVQKEYDAAKKIAKQLDIDPDKVKKCINIIKLEKLLYNELKDAMEYKEQNRK